MEENVQQEVPVDLGALLRGEAIVVDMPFNGGTVRVKYIDTPTLKSITKRSERRGFDAKHQPIREVDGEAMNRVLGEEAVLGWTDEALPGIPFTPENRAFAMTRIHEFSTWVGKTCLDVNAMIEQAKENAAKNS